MQELCPAQKTAYEHLLKSVSVGNVCVVWSHVGMGRTTILKELHREKGGELLTLKDYIDDLRMQNPLQMEEALEQMLMRSINRNDLVILDDLSLIYDVICGCGFMSPYPRAKYIEAILTSIAAKICETEKCVVFSIDGVIPKPLDSRCFNSSIKKYDL
ncbi:MAG: hypothetical protein IAF58_06020, partial [Leptolyngbya sp.]|nr:hypothetical protein [Candidatus Melainabacteria bacterium]